MDRQEITRQLMSVFVAELDEQVEALNRDVLALEKDPSGPDAAELLRSIFRAAHSLKGAARSVDVPLIEEVCHSLEDLLTRAREGSIPLGARLFSLLFDAADALGEARERLRAERDLDGSPIEAILARLDAFDPASPEPEANARRREPEPKAEIAPAPPSAAGENGGPAAAVATRAPEALVDRSRTAAVRVTAEKLDALLAASGELIVARHGILARPADLRSLQDVVRDSREEWIRLRRMTRKSRRDLGPEGAAALSRIGDSLQRLDKELERMARSLRADGRRIEQLSGILDDEVRRARMLPFAEACQSFDRMVRDVARAIGKDVEAIVDGGDVELDRAIIDRLRDPLRHLVRNAADHGIETPAERRARGKPETGRIVVKASLRGAHVEVIVADDGRGLNHEALREQARKRDLPIPTDERALDRLIFLPGLSTARIITDVSGRGVGLDVVKTEVEALHGSIEVFSEPGHGTSFRLIVPLTLTVLRAVLFRVAGRIFALPSLNVTKLVRVPAEEVRSVGGRDVVTLGGPPLPVVPLSTVLGIDGFEPRRDGSVHLLVVTAGDERTAFVVDEYENEQDVMVKSLGRRIRRVRHVSGATILADGTVALVLSAAHLLRAAAASGARSLIRATPEAAKRRNRLLVVDDSVTTRSLEKSILEGAGYEVIVAPDGQAAWDLLHAEGADLVVSDVEMPRVDGFTLTERLRASSRFGEIPIVLVTAREKDEDKARGIAVGANAYLVKNAFDQRNLLETIAQLL